MATPVLTWYDSTGTTQQTTALTFAPVNGTPTAAQTLRLYNDKGGGAGSDDAADLELTVLTRDAGTSDAYSETHSVADGGYVEIRVTGGSPTPVTFGWTPVGGGRWARLSPLGSDEYQTVEVRINVPAGVGAQSCEVLVRPRYAAKATPLPFSAGEAGAHGLRSGLGDASYSALLSGGAVTANGSPDDEVNVAALTAILLGVARCNVGEAVALSQSDVTPTALSSGEAYWATLYLDADGSVAVVKSVLGTSPLTADLLPSPPDNEPILADVQVDYDAGGGAIATGDINFDRRFYGVSAIETSASSLVVTVHGMDGFVGGKRLRMTSTRQLTLPGNDTSYIWRTVGGELEQDTALAETSAGALLLYAVTTDGSGVTGVQDLRVWSSANHRTLWLGRSGDLTASDYTDVVVVPWTMTVLGVVAALNTAGTGTGQTIVDVEKSEAGGAWTSLYPSSATSDVRPTILSEAADPLAVTGIPESPILLAGTRLRGKIIEVPGSTESNGLTLAVHGEARVS